jgi:hypothetical protein
MKRPAFRNRTPREKASLLVSAVTRGAKEIYTPLVPTADFLHAHGRKRNPHLRKPKMILLIDLRRMFES